MYRRIETQLSIEITNAPGEIARINDSLSDNGIAVNAMTIAGETERGYFRFLPENADDAARVLGLNGFDVIREKVISVKLNDQKGRLARITNALAQAHINIDYFYASIEGGESAMRLIMKVENIPLASRVLDEIVEELVDSPELSPA